MAVWSCSIPQCLAVDFSFKYLPLYLSIYLSIFLYWNLWLLLNTALCQKRRTGDQVSSNIINGAQLFYAAFGNAGSIRGFTLYLRLDGL
jgi:hypothetical protein